MIVFTETDIVPNVANFPFAFNSSFSEVYCKEYRGTFLRVKFEGEFNGYIALKLSNSRLLRTAQFLYAPLDSEANFFAAETEKIILESFLKYLKKRFRIHRVTQGINWALFQSYPAGSVKCEFGTYKLNLINQSSNSILTNLHLKHRNVIKNAIKKNVIIKTGKAELATFYKLYSNTMERNGMYCENFMFFERLIDSFGDSIYCGVAYSGDKPEGAIFCPYTKYGAFYLYGCSAEQIEVTGAVNFLQYNFIEYLLSKNVRQYDFVGARINVSENPRLEGIQRFKSRFGSILVKGYLWKKDLSSFRCFIYDFALRAKFLLKGLKKPLDIIDSVNTNDGEK